jgi:hypothetical protein
MFYHFLQKICIFTALLAQFKHHCTEVFWPHFIIMLVSCSNLLSVCILLMKAISYTFSVITTTLKEMPSLQKALPPELADNVLRVTFLLHLLLFVVVSLVLWVAANFQINLYYCTVNE